MVPDNTFYKSRKDTNGIKVSTKFTLQTIRPIVQTLMKDHHMSFLGPRPISLPVLSFMALTPQKANLYLAPLP